MTSRPMTTDGMTATVARSYGCHVSTDSMSGSKMKPERNYFAPRPTWRSQRKAPPPRPHPRAALRRHLTPVTRLRVANSSALSGKSSAHRPAFPRFLFSLGGTATLRVWALKPIEQVPPPPYLRSHFWRCHLVALEVSVHSALGDLEVLSDASSRLASVSHCPGLCLACSRSRAVGLPLHGTACSPYVPKTQLVPP